jgi:dienelactone hydrolase
MVRRISLAILVASSVVALDVAALDVTAAARAQELAKGTVLDDVRCAADATESYALYVPSTYSPNRPWNLLMAFHPAARGRAMVEKFRAAAEQYGYIVAGSNTSRNGPWAASSKAVQAMALDLGQRFAIDSRRVYLTGMSGGARVALQVALGTNAIAGVIASSAGFPDSQPRQTVPFAIFGTAGTEDFNYLEMRAMDRRLKSPHRLAVFDGGHTLPPDTVAFEAIEWLELQAMTSGLRARDESLIDAMLQKRRRVIEASGGAVAVQQLEALVDDFKSLRDVSAESARLVALSKDKDVKATLARERRVEDNEQRMIGEFFEIEQRLSNPDTRPASLGRLRGQLEQWSRTAKDPTASPERAQARRLLSTAAAGASSRTGDVEYLAMLNQYRRTNLQ